MTCGKTIAEASQMAEDAKKEGISMNQYCIYNLSKELERTHCKQ